MVNFINKATIQGNIGSDPVTRTSKKGDKFATFSVATQVEYKKDNGQQVKFTEWHNVVIFDSFLALLARGAIAKGDMVYIEGALSTSSWEDKDGKAHHKTQIVVRNSKFHILRKVDK